MAVGAVVCLPVFSGFSINYHSLRADINACMCVSWRGGCMYRAVMILYSQIGTLLFLQWLHFCPVLLPLDLICHSFGVATVVYVTS